MILQLELRTYVSAGLGRLARPKLAEQKLPPM